MILNTFFIELATAPRNPINLSNPSVSFSSVNENKGYALLGYVIKTTAVNTSAECFEECVKERPNCRSYNVEFNETKTLKSCELNYKTKEEVSSSFFRSKLDYVHFRMIQ